jgi:hypothetical protein
MGERERPERGGAMSKGFRCSFHLVSIFEIRETVISLLASAPSSFFHISEYSTPKHYER